MIEVKNLSKRYGAVAAVSDVSFSCQPGTVTGFLGPNGAGKSTTMRMICGLTLPSSGSATVAGVPFAQLPNPASTVGVLLDASAQHNGRTGRETLAIVARTIGASQSRVPEMLEFVGLPASAAKRRVGNYSLGMRQRLGLAQALLGQPDVLVLDEPANGLDPEGIRWMRQLLRSFADQGGTVLLSSHLLSEVEAIADNLVVIAGGSIVANAPKQQLLAGAGTVVGSRNLEGLANALAAANLAVSRSSDGSQLLVQAAPEAVGIVAAEDGIPLLELRAAEGAGLENLFMSLTSDASSNQPAEAPVGVGASTGGPHS